MRRKASSIPKDWDKSMPCNEDQAYYHAHGDIRNGLLLPKLHAGSQTYKHKASYPYTGLPERGTWSSAMYHAVFYKRVWIDGLEQWTYVRLPYAFIHRRSKMHALAGATFGKVICNGNDIDEAIAMDQDGGSSLLATTPMLEMLEAASAISPAVLRPFVAKVASETANRLKDSQLAMEGTISGAFTVIASFCRTGLNASRMSARSRGLLCSADAHEGVYAVLLWYEDGESPATPTRQTLRFYRAPFASKERAQSVYAQGEAAAIQYHYDTVEQHD